MSRGSPPAGPATHPSSTRLARGNSARLFLLQAKRSSLAGSTASSSRTVAQLQRPRPCSERRRPSPSTTTRAPPGSNSTTSLLRRTSRSSLDEVGARARVRRALHVASNCPAFARLQRRARLSTLRAERPPLPPAAAPVCGPQMLDEGPYARRPAVLPTVQCVDGHRFGFPAWQHESQRTALEVLVDQPRRQHGDAGSV